MIPYKTYIDFSIASVFFLQGLINFLNIFSIHSLTKLYVKYNHKKICLGAEQKVYCSSLLKAAQINMQQV